MPSKRASFEYIPAIDGMRALAIILVLASHFGLGKVVPGGFGVTLFFFISGFLITRLLIAEHNKAGKISISSFYARRFLRLAPALIVMIFFASLSYSLLIGPINPLEIFAAVFYYINYYGLSHALALPIQVLWSLAVEEHYYAIYPLVFSRFWKYQGRFIFGLAIVTVTILLWRVFLALATDTPIWTFYYRTDTRIDSILYGAILAGMLEAERYKWVLPKLGSVAVVVFGALALLLTFVLRNEMFRETARYSLQGMALIPVFYSILFVDRFTSIRRLLELPVLLWIGRLSYSLYLWHMLSTFWIDEIYSGNAPIAHALLAVSLSFAVAALSYYGIEKPFQAMRRALRQGQMANAGQDEEFRRHPSTIHQSAIERGTGKVGKQEVK